MAANTPAMIVCPGGGYVSLASNHEGRQVASYLNSLGIAAFVLRSRLGPRYHHPIELGDAQRAIRMLRAHASEWRIDPARIGIMGFSAGGHLAMTASTLFDAGDPGAPDPIDRPGSRPDFTVLGYPVISMTESWTHQGSKNNLLGANPRNWQENFPANWLSRNKRRRHFCSTRMPTRRFRPKTACTTTSR